MTCIATLTQRSLFVDLVLQAVPTRCVYTLTAPLLCSRHFNIYSSHLLSKSTDREDSSFFFFLCGLGGGVIMLAVLSCSHHANVSLTDDGDSH